MAYGNTECYLLESTGRSRSKKLGVTLSSLRSRCYRKKYVIVLAVHSCSIFSILSAHSKKRLLLRKVLFSASCNLARSKLIFTNIFICFSSLRANLLKPNFLAKQLQNCSYLKAYICTYVHIYIYMFLYLVKIQNCFMLGYCDLGPTGKKFLEGIYGKKKIIMGVLQLSVWKCWQLEC